MHPAEVVSPMRVSKYYSARELWFFTFPAEFLLNPHPGHLAIVLEHEKTPQAFHLLKVPFAYFRESKGKFDLRHEGDKFDLHLSARRSSWLRDLRSKGVEFSQFLV